MTNQFRDDDEVEKLVIPGIIEIIGISKKYVDSISISVSSGNEEKNLFLWKNDDKVKEYREG